jgi:hypothetical protein
MLRKIQEASNKTNSTDSVRWYTIPTDTAMPKADVTYSHIGFIGTVGTNATFTLYLDNQKTGAKTYHVYFKQLGGSGKLTLTTGKAGASNLVMNVGTYVAIIYVDENGNVRVGASTPTSTIASGNNQPATSEAVANYKTDTVASGNDVPVTSNAVAEAVQEIKTVESSLPTDAVLHYSFDEVPDYPDGTADVRLLDNNTYDIQSTDAKFRNNGGTTFTNNNGNLVVSITGGDSTGAGIASSSIYTKIVKFKIKVTQLTGELAIIKGNERYLTITNIGEYELTKYIDTNNYLWFYCLGSGNSCAFTVEQIYIGNGSYTTPVIDNANGEWNSTSQSGVAVQGVSGKGLKTLKTQVNIGNFNLNDDFTIAIWVNPENNTSGQAGNILTKSNQFILRNGISWGNYLMMYLYMNGADGFRKIGDLITPNRWTHIVITKNGTTLNIYRDGTRTHNFTTSQNAIDKNDNDLILSANGNNRSQSYDDLLIFNRALSQEEVTALYLNKANTPKYYPQPTDKIEQNNWGLATSGGVYKALGGWKIKEISGTYTINTGYFAVATGLPTGTRFKAFVQMCYTSSTIFDYTFTIQENSTTQRLIVYVRHPDLTLPTDGSTINANILILYL